MSIPQGYSTLIGDTVDQLVLDAGTCWLNFNKTIFESSGLVASATAPSATWVDPNGTTVVPTPLGATRGGATISLNITETPIEFDGRRGMIKGMTRRFDISPQIEVTLLQMGGFSQVKLQMGSSIVTNVGTSNTYAKLQPTFAVQDTDYYGNVALIAAETNTNGLPKVYLFENVRVTQPAAEDLRDKSESTCKVIIHAHYLPSAPLNVPYYVYQPIVGTGS